MNFSRRFFQDIKYLETSMRESDFIFDSAHLLCHKCQKVNFRRGGSYVDSPDLVIKRNDK